MQVIDPKQFIRPPFSDCPHCGRTNFGVLMILGDRFVKRCRDCRFDAEFALPELTNKIIYLDQFVVSNMMKSINPASPAFQDDRVKPFRPIYEKLDRLCKLQLVVCPYSRNHRYESMVSGSYEPLKRMYHQLSHGASFCYPEEIKQSQIYRSVQVWLGKDAEETEARDVISGKLHQWRERFMLTVNVPFSESFAEEITTQRDQVSTGLHTCFKIWQTESGVKFDDFYLRELTAYGPGLLEQHHQYLLSFSQAIQQGQMPDIDLMFSSTETLLRIVKDQVRMSGVPEAERGQRVEEYCHSDALQQVPFVRIAALLLAALAYEASTGRKKLPSQGMMNDIEVIASYAPYCDAIFVDKECHSLLSKMPTNSVAGRAKADLRLADKVFSLNNLDEFEAYLDGIEKTASGEHLAMVEQVYGPDWGQPFTSMYG